MRYLAIGQLPGLGRWLATINVAKCPIHKPISPQQEQLQEKRSPPGNDSALKSMNNPKLPALQGIS